MENDGMITKKDTENKYIFWDIDGTLAAYRFNGHVLAKDGTDNGMSLEEIDNGLFLKRKPSLFMQNVVKTCGAKENIIMGHCMNEKEIEDKHIWLDKYYPMIKERIFAFEDKSKANCIIDYCEKRNINLKDVLYVDDVIKFIKEAERKGISSWHISSFLDWEYGKR